jgi:hypothetical protein
MLTFEQENQSALDGTAVWKALVEKQKAFAVGAFDAKALLHNLNDGDYDRPLDEVRDLFWSSPRMPLLPGGDGDLQRAIFQALDVGTIRLVGSDGLDRIVNRPGDIGVGQSGLRLLEPPTGDVDEEEKKEEEKEKEKQEGEEKREKEGQQQLSFSLMTTITENDKREAVRLLLRSLSYAVDEGKVSYAQLMVRVNADSSVAEEIAEEARGAGASPRVKKVV